MQEIRIVYIFGQISIFTYIDAIYITISGFVINVLAAPLVQVDGKIKF